MDVILSTAFGVKADTQTVENDPITEKAKMAMAPNPLIAYVRKNNHFETFNLTRRGKHSFTELSFWKIKHNSMGNTV